MLRGWVRPLGEPTDVLFALLAGDILPPTVFNLGGRVGWAPTVQLTALLRARPAPGWLRMEAAVDDGRRPWFDEDATVVDSAGPAGLPGPPARPVPRSATRPLPRTARPAARVTVRP